MPTNDDLAKLMREEMAANRKEILAEIHELLAPLNVTMALHSAKHESTTVTLAELRKDVQQMETYIMNNMHQILLWRGFKNGAMWVTMGIVTLLLAFKDTIVNWLTK